MEEDGQNQKRMKKDEEEKERQEILTGTADPGMRAFMAWTFRNTDQNVAARDATDARVTTLGQAVNSQGLQLQDISKRQDAFESRMALLEGTGSVASGVSTATGTQRVQSSFIPTFVECYGWVQDWTTAVTRARTMIADDQAEALLKNAIDIIHAEDELVSARIDTEGSKRAARAKPMSGSVRIRFKKGTEEDVLFQAQNALTRVNDDPAQRQKLFSDMVSPLARIRFRVEAPPWKIPHNQAVGRFYGEWSKIIPNVYVKGTTGAGKSPSYMWTDPVEGKRTQFAEFKAAEYGGNGQWKILTDSWPAFATRHSIQQTPAQIEAAVATRSL